MEDIMAQTVTEGHESILRLVDGKWEILDVILDNEN
jgi:hypothetical protein